jgi:hypothetical protein
VSLLLALAVFVAVAFVLVRLASVAGLGGVPVAWVFAAIAGAFWPPGVLLILAFLVFRVATKRTT